MRFSCLFFENSLEIASNLEELTRNFTTAFFVGSVGAVRIVVALVTSINAAAISTLELLMPACRLGHWRRLKGFGRSSGLCLQFNKINVS